MSEPKLSERIRAAGNKHLEAWTEAMMPLQWADEVAALEADNAALRKRVEGLEEALRITQGSHDTWMRQYVKAQKYIRKLKSRIGFALAAEEEEA